MVSHSSRTAARIYWVGIRRDRSSGVGKAVVAAAAVVEKVGRSIGSRNSPRTQSSTNPPNGITSREIKGHRRGGLTKGR